MKQKKAPTKNAAAASGQQKPAAESAKTSKKSTKVISKYKPGTRLESLDALRGFDMLFIMGFAALVTSICQLWPDGSGAQWLSGQMQHAAWHGLFHHDTIFPLFLFLAGVSFPFSLSSQQARHRTTGQIVWKVIRRGLVLALLGMVYNGLFNFDFSHLRWASVLGRIGIAWMLAALLYMFLKPRHLVIISVVVLLGYWALLYFCGDAADPYSYTGNFVGVVDRALLPGRLIYGKGMLDPSLSGANFFDPEGILGTFPAMVTALLGMLTGTFVRLPDSRVTGNRKALYMLYAAFVFAFIGWAWNVVFPINKMMWTSSFVCALAGYSLALFALFYWLIDVKGWRKWAMPLRVIGMNSITIYLAQRIVNFHGISNFFFSGLAGKCSDVWADIISGTGYIVVCWLFLYFLYKKKIFLKV